MWVLLLAYARYKWFYAHNPNGKCRSTRFIHVHRHIQLFAVYTQIWQCMKHWKK